MIITYVLILETLKCEKCVLELMKYSRVTVTIV